MTPDEFDGYVTKYALTSGITRDRLKVSRDCPSMVSSMTNDMAHYHGEGREWHRTWESALQAAERMKTRRIASMRKSIAALEALKFEEPPAQ